VSRTTHSKRAGQAGIVVAAALALGVAAPAAEASHVGLGVAGPFVVLGSSTVTNTGTSVLNGDLGVSPGSALTGFEFAVVNGVTHQNDAVAANAQAANVTAHNAAAGEAVLPGNILTGQDLGLVGPLTPGVYRFASSAQLTGQLTLDAQGDPNAQFIFQIGTTLTTASASSVNLINGASPCNVFWQVGSSATIGTTTAMAGNILAKESATLTNGATLRGRMLAQTGSVTLDDNRLDASMCQPGARPRAPKATDRAATADPTARAATARPAAARPATARHATAAAPAPAPPAVRQATAPC
jgi:hypothetical protein